jgi:hypothetical protein
MVLGQESGMMGQIFVEHPREVGETYFEHQRFAAGCGVMLLGAGAAAIVHAVVPCLFTRTAGNMVARLNQTLASRRIAAS